MNNLITTTAQSNFDAICEDGDLRVEIFGGEREVVTTYLRTTEEIAWSDPGLQQTLCSIDEQIAQGARWQTMPELICVVPVVGTGNQETSCVDRFFEEVSKDETVLTGSTRFIFMVNRPQGVEADGILDYIVTAASSWGIPIDVLDVTIPEEIGRVSDTIPEMAEEPNQPYIGIIRNLLDIAAMKLALNASDVDARLPEILQMDIDFEGFAQGDFQRIVDTFRNYPLMQFLQCTSDWDSQDYPTSQDPLLKLGSDLMRMLPLVLKAELNKPLNGKTAEVVFGEVVQRGIQVPQVRRMQAAAITQSYGLLRFTADELDYNMRNVARWCLEGVRSAANIVFTWNNRRAVAAWQTYGRPPISQWSSETAFSVNDAVRNVRAADRDTDEVTFEDRRNVINLTLQRMPIPAPWAEEYKRKFEVVLSQVAQSRVVLSTSEIDQKGRVTYVVLPGINVLNTIQNEG